MPNVHWEVVSLKGVTLTFDPLDTPPFFLEYELVPDDIFIANDDHNVEDSESNDKDEDQNEGEEGKEGEGH